MLVGAAILLFFANGPSWLFRIVMPLVLLANLEEIAITLALPRLIANVPSFWHALKIRAGSEKAGAVNVKISPALH